MWHDCLHMNTESYPLNEGEPYGILGIKCADCGFILRKGHWDGTRSIDKPVAHPEVSVSIPPKGLLLDRVNEIKGNGISYYYLMGIRDITGFAVMDIKKYIDSLNSHEDMSYEGLLNFIKKEKSNHI